MGSIKQFKTQYGEQFNHFQAEAGSIPALSQYNGKSVPTFLVFFSGMLVHVIRGVNVPLMEKVVKEQFDLEAKGMEHVEFKDGDYTILKAGLNLGLAKEPANGVTGSSGGLVETTLAVIKPDGMSSKTIGLVLDTLIQNRFNIIAVRKVWLNEEQARRLYYTLEHQAWFDKLVKYISSGPVLGIYMARENAIQEWRDLMGPGNAQRARNEKPHTIRAQCGIDSVRNAVHGSDSKDNVEKERAVIFDESVMELALPELVQKALAGDTTVLVPDDDSTLVERTVCIIKPHVVSQGQAAVDAILQVAQFHGFEEIRHEEVHISNETALELLGSHAGDAESKQQVADDLSSAPAAAILLKGFQVIPRWLEILGPESVTEAKIQAPQSIRARLGTSEVNNVAIATRNHDETLTWSHLLLPRTTSSSKLQT